MAPNSPIPDTAPKAYGPSSKPPPPAGLRTPCTTTSSFPDLASLGPVPFHDLGGEPVYVASAIMGDSVHPCKAAPHLSPPVRVPFGGGEMEHHGRFDILPITPAMEWVSTSHGRIPPGRRAVEGGYEADGAHLFHAGATLTYGEGTESVRVPGKTGEHLLGANFAFGGREIVKRDGYVVLCWR